MIKQKLSTYEYMTFEGDVLKEAQLIDVKNGKNNLYFG